MAKKKKTYSQTVALRAIVNVPVVASSLEEAKATGIELSDVASFAGKGTVHDWKLDVVGVSEDTGWDFLDD